MQKDTWIIIGVMVTLVGLLATFMVTGLTSIESRLTAMDNRLAAMEIRLAAMDERLHELNTRISRIEGHLRLPAEVEPIHFEAIGLTIAAKPTQEFEYLYRSPPYLPGSYTLMWAGRVDGNSLLQRKRLRGPTMLPIRSDTGFACATRRV